MPPQNEKLPYNVPTIPKVFSPHAFYPAWAEPDASFTKMTPLLCYETTNCGFYISVEIFIFPLSLSAHASPAVIQLYHRDLSSNLQGQSFPCMQPVQSKRLNRISVNICNSYPEKYFL